MNLQKLAGERVDKSSRHPSLVGLGGSTANFVISRESKSSVWEDQLRLATGIVILISRFMTQSIQGRYLPTRWVICGPGNFAQRIPYRYSSTKFVVIEGRGLSELVSLGNDPPRQIIRRLMETPIGIEDLDGTV